MMTTRTLKRIAYSGGLSALVLLCHAAPALAQRQERVAFKPGTCAGTGNRRTEGRPPGAGCDRCRRSAAPAAVCGQRIRAADGP